MAYRFLEEESSPKNLEIHNQEQKIWKEILVFFDKESSNSKIRVKVAFWLQNLISKEYWSWLWRNEQISYYIWWSDEQCQKVV